MNSDRAGWFGRALTHSRKREAIHSGSACGPGTTPGLTPWSVRLRYVSALTESAPFVIAITVE